MIYYVVPDNADPTKLAIVGRAEHMPAPRNAICQAPKGATQKDAAIVKVIQVQDPSDETKTINKAVFDADKRTARNAADQARAAANAERRARRQEIELRLKDAELNFNSMKRAEKDDLLLDLLRLNNGTY